MVSPISNVARLSTKSVKSLRLALVQLASRGNGKDNINISRAVSFVEQAKQRGADIVVLPEAFNTGLNLPFHSEKFKDYTENVPAGETCLALSDAAKKNEICIVGGSIFERAEDKPLNTSTVWNAEGEFVGKYSKMHLFDVDIKGKMTLKESDFMSSGNSLMTFLVKDWKIGLGICYDLRFEQFARLYRNLGCHLLLYPGAFNLITGPLHYSLLQRARAVDNQLYVAGICPARVESPGYVAYGHSQLTDPWGKVVDVLGPNEGLIVADLDMSVIDAIRAQIPISKQQRTDLYESTYWKNN